MSVGVEDVGQVITAHDATLEGPVVSEGVLVGYSHEPTVTIEDGEGRRTHWIASLCRRMDADAELAHWKERAEAAELVLREQARAMGLPPREVEPGE